MPASVVTALAAHVCNGRLPADAQYLGARLQSLAQLAPRFPGLDAHQVSWMEELNT